MVIRVSGHPGSGKTTFCKRLAETTDYEYHYAGGILRTMAKEKEMSIEDFYKSLESNPAVEKELDQKQAELMCSKDNLIMEGRIAPFLPSSFPTCNVLLTVDAIEGAKRNMLRLENENLSFEEVAAKTKQRLAIEREHYRDLYEIEDHLDPKHFEIVIDTTNLSPEEVFDSVRQKLTLISS